MFRKTPVKTKVKKKRFSNLKQEAGYYKPSYIKHRAYDDFEKLNQTMDDKSAQRTVNEIKKVNQQNRLQVFKSLGIAMLIVIIVWMISLL